MWGAHVSLHRGEEYEFDGRARSVHVEDRRGSNLLLQTTRPLGGRCGWHDREWLLQGGVQGATDGVRGRGEEAAGCESGGERRVMIVVHSTSEAGGHPVNEDAFVVLQHRDNAECWICTLADGQGGQPNGGPASKL